MLTRVKAGVKHCLKMAGYRIEHESLGFRVYFQRTVEALLDRRYSTQRDRFFFVQIGANDGVNFDWLYSWVQRHPRISGIVVEPVQDYFDELTRNYAPFPAVRPLRAAVYREAENRTVPIYRVAREWEREIDWGKGIASLDPEHHRLQGGAIPEEAIRREDVPTISWDALIEQHQVGQIDYLQIDTEGYDAEILRMVRAAALRPHIIRFERWLHANAMQVDDYLEQLTWLTRDGYLILADVEDVVAYRPELA